MKIVIYRTRGIGPGRGLRWRLLAENSKVIANGGQAYSRRTDMVHAIEVVLGGALRGDWLDRPVRTAMDVYAPSSPFWAEAIPVEDRTR